MTTKEQRSYQDLTARGLRELVAQKFPRRNMDCESQSEYGSGFRTGAMIGSILTAWVMSLLFAALLIWVL